MICCAESTPRPGTSASRLNGILVLAEQTGHLLVQFADLLVDQSQFLQRHLQQPPVDGVQLRARAERVAQLCRCGAQALISQNGQGRWAGFTVSERLQHTTGN